jgi:hypothetical protein
MDLLVVLLVLVSPLCHLHATHSMWFVCPVYILWLTTPRWATMQDLHLLPQNLASFAASSSSLGISFSASSAWLDKVPYHGSWVPKYCPDESSVLLAFKRNGFRVVRYGSNEIPTSNEIKLAKLMPQLIMAEAQVSDFRIFFYVVYVFFHTLQACICLLCKH